MACGEPPETVTVLAASSLTDAFTALQATFADAHPNTRVVLSFAGSQTLATQVEHGIEADVFASADAQHVERLVTQDLAHDAAPFATGTLVWVTPPDAVTTGDPATWARAERLVLGTPEVPVGRYTDALFDAAEAQYGPAWRAEVQQAVVSREPNVRLVLAKVVLGEADAAIVYASDVTGRNDVVAHAIRDALAPRPTYVHARLSDGDGAHDWMRTVQSEDGRSILREHGFGAAP